MIPSDLSRRAFLASVSAGVGTAWLAARWPDIRAAQEHARKAAQTIPRAGFQFLTAAEAADVEAVTARIIPTDETPGAREAGAVYFIDRALTTFFSAGHRADYRKGLKSLTRTVRSKFPGAKSFAGLQPEQQDAVLKGIEKTDFFEMVRSDTIIGFLSNPEYGGNRDKAGWRVMGFEDQFVHQPPFGFYDADRHNDR